MNGCKVYYAGYIMQPGVDGASIRIITARRFVCWTSRMTWRTATCRSGWSCAMTTVQPWWSRSKGCGWWSQSLLIRDIAECDYGRQIICTVPILWW